MSQAMPEDTRSKEVGANDAIARILLRLRLIHADMQALLEGNQARQDDAHAAIEHWALALGTIVLQAAKGSEAAAPGMQDLLVLALSGMNVTADAQHFNLHEMTQLAAALRPGAELTVLNSLLMSPIGKDSVATAKPKQVTFQ